MGTNASQLKLPETNQVNKLESKESLNKKADSGFKNVNVFKDIVLQDVGQKGGSVSAGEIAEAGSINTLT